MGKLDRRNSLKMSRKKAQVKKKLRIKRLAAAKGAENGRKATKKPRVATKASAPPASTKSAPAT